MAKDASTAHARIALVVAHLLLVCACRLRHCGSLHGATLSAMMCLGFSLAQNVVPVAPYTVSDVDDVDGALWRVRLDSFVSIAPSSHRPQLLASVTLLAHRDELGLWQPSLLRARVRFNEGCPIGIGDVVVARLGLRAWPRHDAPWQPTKTRVHRYQQLSATAIAVGPHVMYRPSSSILRRIDGVRQAAMRLCLAELEPTSAALVMALALGDARHIAHEARDVFAQSGVAHLLAVSGLHIGMITGLVLVFMRRLFWALPFDVGRAQEPLAAGVALLASMAYALLSGLSFATLRAFVMAAFLLACRIVGTKHPDMAQTLGLAGLCIVLAWPQAVVEPSFLLSFVAVLSLVAFTPAKVELQPPKKDSGKKSISVVLDGFLQNLRTSCVVTAATAPLCAFFFGQVSCVAPFTNLVAVPVGAGVLTPLALLWLLLRGVVFLGDAYVQGAAHFFVRVAHTILSGVAYVLDVVVSCFYWSIEHVARFSFSSIWVFHPSGIQLGLMAIVFMGAMSSYQYRQHFRPCPKLIVAVSLWALASLCFYGACAITAPKGDGKLHLTFIDVGQGDATLIRLPDGAALLVDGGGRVTAQQTDPGRAQVWPVLRHMGVRALAVMVLTHPHPDHLGGLAYVAERLPIAELWLNTDGLMTHNTQTLRRRLMARGTKVGPAPKCYQRAGVTIRSMQAVTLADAGLNDKSLAMLIAHGKSRVLLTGDVETKGETALLAHDVAADVLKVAHHGSKTSSGSDFLRAVSPKLAIISCGLNNRFGFPHKDVLARLDEVGAHVWRTDLMGSMQLTSDGSGSFFRP